MQIQLETSETDKDALAAQLAAVEAKPALETMN